MRFDDRQVRGERGQALPILALLLVLALLALVGAWYWSPVTGVPVPLVGEAVDALRGAPRLLAAGDRGRPEPVASPSAAVAPSPSPSAVAPATTATPAFAATVNEAPPAPRCRPGQPPVFVLGFAELKRQLGDIMGEPLECERVNPDNGDTLQRTTTGLAVYRQRTGLLMFTDGWRKWALTPAGLVAWEGEREDPPPQ